MLPLELQPLPLSTYLNKKSPVKHSIEISFQIFMWKSCKNKFQLTEYWVSFHQIGCCGSNGLAKGQDYMNLRKQSCSPFSSFFDSKEKVFLSYDEQQTNFMSSTQVVSLSIFPHFKLRPMYQFLPWLNELMCWLRTLHNYEGK